MINKREILLGLKQGTMIKLTTGEIVKLERVKQKKFIGIINEKKYDILIDLFSEVIQTKQDSNQDSNNVRKNDPKKDNWLELASLKQGTIVSLKNGEEAEFIRLKQKNFTGIINGTSYSIPVSMFVSVIKDAKENTGYENLKPGENFFINNNTGDALLFIFKEISNNRIIGINPITKVQTKISKELYAGKVSEL